MTAPDVEQELERLLTATREGTAPDADARARIRAALALGLASGGASPLEAVVHTGRGAKLWLLSTLGVAVAVGLGLWLSSPVALPTPAARSALPPTALVSEALPSALPAVSSQVSPAASASASVVSVPSVPSTPVKARAPQADDPAAELALVSSMQLALRSGNASQVLALANEHAQRFPSGALVQEREGARAIARCQLARPAGRGAIFTAFEQRYASSPYAARVRAACAP